jgi:hypothetical protein
MTVQRRLMYAILGAAIAVPGASCRATDGVDSARSPIAGTFALATINGNPLPDTLFDVLTRDGGHTGCCEIATMGWITLDSVRHHFLISRHIASTCGMLHASDTTAFGEYRSPADSLRLTMFDGTDSVLFPAHTTASQIIVDDQFVHWQYAFSR